MANDCTYSGDPSTSNLDAVRCLLGDVGGESGSTWILTNLEIKYFDDLCAPIFGDPLMTAAVCADIIAGRYAGEVSISADGVSVSSNDLQSKYTQLGASLRNTYKTLAAVGGYPVVGGIDAFHPRDPSLRPLNFALGMNDNYRAGAQGAYDTPEDWYYAWTDSEPW